MREIVPQRVILSRADGEESPDDEAAPSGDPSSSARLRMTADCNDVCRELKRIGLLLLQDKKLPSVVGIITGESLSTSWWSHSRSQEIFKCLEALEKVAIATNLISGKVTFVHERLWPAVVSIGAAREPWQKAGLGRNPTTKEQRERLIAYAEEIHTESGRHETRLQPWEEFARERGVVTIAAEAARQEIEAATLTLGTTSRALPWHRFATR